MEAITFILCFMFISLTFAQKVDVYIMDYINKISIQNAIVQSEKRRSLIQKAITK
ncbi:hypothetical protein FACS189432_04190 [Bacteroidia bacterium]|nr:hypothetical protein FACS189432_04190 [Bacteroidia bacterium]